MGAKQSKIEGTYLPDTPTIQQIKLSRLDAETNGNPKEIVNDADPRSPSGSRTPLNFAALNPQIKKQVVTFQEQTPVANNENALGVLRRRFLKSFMYNLNDPRSPSTEMNRTPLVFDDNDRTFNMDDTFADLFVESKAMPEEFTEKANIDSKLPKENFNDLKIIVDEESETTNLGRCNTSLEMVSNSYGDEETLPCPALLYRTPVIEQQEIDPRSPTYGVKRTPILFEDNDEANEDEIIENILATLSLDKSTNSSILSFGTPTSGSEPKKNEELKPTNKHLERVRLGNKKVCQTGKSGRTRRQRQRVYEDVENQESTTTPKLKKFDDNNGELKRTPLSCVKNRSLIRSRSVEMSEKAIKTRLSLSSFDDNLNPNQNSKVINLRILQDNGDGMDF